MIKVYINSKILDFGDRIGAVLCKVVFSVGFVNLASGLLIKGVEIKGNKNNYTV